MIKTEITFDESLCFQDFQENFNVILRDLYKSNRKQNIFLTCKY